MNKTSHLVFLGFRDYTLSMRSDNLYQIYQLQDDKEVIRRHKDMYERLEQWQKEMIDPEVRRLLEEN